MLTLTPYSLIYFILFIMINLLRYIMNFIVSWNFHSSGILSRIERSFLTDVSAHYIGPIFKGWEIQEERWPLRMGPIRCPETSVGNYHSRLRNIPEERRSHLHRSETPKTFIVCFFLEVSVDSRSLTPV